MFEFSLEALQSQVNRVDWNAIARVSYGEKTMTCKLWLAGLIDKPASPIALKLITQMIGDFPKYIDKMASYKEFVDLVNSSFDTKYSHKEIVQKMIETGHLRTIRGALDGSVEVEFNCPKWLLTFEFKGDSVTRLSVDD